jgi:hypothetical protein
MRSIIMSITSLGRIVLVCAAVTMAVETDVTHPSLVQAAARDALKLATTLSGCVSHGNMAVDPVRSSPLASDRKRHDEGHRIQIVGGLVPSATLAAQAGAIDPAIVAMAAAGGSAGTGLVPASDAQIEPSDVTATGQIGSCH